MSDDVTSNILWEEEMRQRVRQYPYPATPDIAGRVQTRLHGSPQRRPVLAQRRPVLAPRLAWALLLIVAVALFGAEPVRAWVVEILRIGAVRIFVQPSPSPVPPAAPLSSVLDLEGATTLADARQRLPFPIRLPRYPAGLGEPDGVFVQDLDGPALVMVWVDPAQRDRPYLTLHMLRSPALVYKMGPKRIASTTVHGGEALWTDGPYLVQDGTGKFTPRRLIEGHVLIWTQGAITYRLETDLKMEEAVRIAESLEATNAEP